MRNDNDLFPWVIVDVFQGKSPWDPVRVVLQGYLQRITVEVEGMPLSGGATARATLETATFELTLFDATAWVSRDEAAERAARFVDGVLP